MEIWMEEWILRKISDLKYWGAFNVIVTAAGKNIWRELLELPL
jgi:hypothetical protein